MNWRSIQIVLFVAWIFALQGCGNFSDNTSDAYSEISSKLSSSSTSSSLSSKVISELKTNLNSTSSSRSSRSGNITRVSTRSTSKTLTNSLSSSQITLVTDAATTAVLDAGMGSSGDLIQLMPKIIEGSQSKLASVGLSGEGEAWVPGARWVPGRCGPRVRLTARSPAPGRCSGLARTRVLKPRDRKRMIHDLGGTRVPREVLLGHVCLRDEGLRELRFPLFYCVSRMSFSHRRDHRIRIQDNSITGRRSSCFACSTDLFIIQSRAPRAGCCGSRCRCRVRW